MEENQKTNYAGKKFEVGEVLAQSWSMLFRNPLVFFGLPFLAAVISIILGFTLLRNMDLIRSIFSLFLNLIMQGAFVYAVFQSFMGSRASFGASLSQGLVRLLPMSGICIVGMLAIFIGIIFLIVPGIILACMYYVSIPVCVVEKLGVFSSLSRSAELTKGYRWQVFGLTIIVYVAMIVLGIIVQVITIGLLSIAGPIVMAVILPILFILPQAFGNVLATTIYYNLRVAKENITIDALSSVFD